MVDLYKGHLVIIEQSQDMLSVFQQKKIAAIISIEGLHQIGNSNSVLRNYGVSVGRPFFRSYFRG